MEKTEQVLEAFLDLERSRQRESELRIDYESQLQGIRSIIEAESKDSLFAALVSVLKTLIHCEHVFILKSEEDGSMRPTLSTRAQIQDTHWFPDTLFQRVLRGKPAAVFNINLVKEWHQQSEESREGIASALHFKLEDGEEASILVCTHTARRHFNPTHIKQLRRFMPFVSQGFATLELKQAVRERDRFFALSLELMAIIDKKGYFKQLNHAWQTTFGYTEKQIKSRPFFNFIRPRDRQQLIHKLSSVTKQNAPLLEECRFRRSDGRTIWLSCSIVMNTQDDLYYISARDVTARVKAEQQLLKDATHDALTGLHNRSVFVDHLVKVLQYNHRRKHFDFALLYFDLDRFKLINDSLGHLVGDQVLVEISKRIKETVRSADSIARLGGDEFAILLIDINQAADVISLTKRLIERIEEPLHLNRREIKISASVGITLSRDDHTSSEEVLRDADIAMYAAKNSSKSKYMLFDKKMHAKALALLQLEMDMDSALKHSEFILVYQAIVEMKTEKIISFEALVRWQHPERGMIPPSDFIPLAEENGFIMQLGTWIFKTACEKIKTLRTKHPKYKNTSIHINISPRQFWKNGFVEELVQVVSALNLPPKAIILEVTESVILQNAMEAFEIFEKIKQHGFPLYIDDFGTGYSSLSYLHQFPFEGLKIDRSFVDVIEKDKKCNELIKTIIQLAKNFGLEVVAEGVEKKEQSDYLMAQGCKYAQGYLYAEPQEEID
ncbi:MAG: EAL domain-containing protein [Nitrospirae bacterium]|nr:EAL domain-containing protein [Candidatus Manganitrophaceae bacterium]